MVVHDPPEKLTRVRCELTDITPCLKELKVEVPWEAVRAEMEVVYKELGKTARVPGFRVGHAPRDLLERYHGAKAREETLDRVIRESMAEALRARHKLDLVGRPAVSDVRFAPNRPLSYQVRLEVAPEVPLGRYKGLRLIRPQADLSEEAVGRVLARLQEAHAQLKPVLEPRAAAPGDFLLADLTECRPGVPPRTEQDQVIHLDLEKDPQGILKPLVGLQPGEARSVTLPGGVGVEVRLKEIKCKELLPLDDAFARSVGPYDSLEMLRQVVREDLRHQAEAAQQRALQAQAVEQLLKGWTVEPPPSLVASSAQRIQQEEKVSGEEAREAAVREVRMFYILRRIAAEEGICATEEEIEARIQGIAGHLKKTAEEVRGDLAARDLLEDVAWSLIRGKVLELILKEASIQEPGGGNS